MKILVIIPYFGKLPNYFELWLHSAKFNTKFEWMLFLDDTKEYDFPENVHVEYTSFQALKEHIQSKFDFPIALSFPYKLCDFRPAYGYIFDDYVKGYDFWGYGDLDVLYGNLSNFITDEFLSKYDKILPCGHLTLFRNNDMMNSSYRLQAPGLPYYEEVFSNDKAFTFDEWGGVTRIFKAHPINQYGQGIMADISWYSFRFKHAMGHPNYKKECFVWINGTLFQLFEKNKSVETTEYPYIHLQKRKMKVNYSVPLDLATTIVITPEGFEILNRSDILTSAFLDKYAKFKIGAFLSFYSRLAKRGIKKLQKKIPKSLHKR